MKEFQPVFNPLGQTFTEVTKPIVKPHIVEDSRVLTLRIKKEQQLRKGK